MEKLNGINDVLYHLKDKEILTTTLKDFFVLKKGRVYRYFNGSAFNLSLEDFADLYKDTDFYIYEDESVFIDNEKDEDYYRYYKK
ncbi:MAG: hypothetical protein Q4B60_06565 [Erysipelotrichaceae bacterium]|nr:hypothetical protein [Erysipelotrichaceae bacterium]